MSSRLCLEVGSAYEGERLDRFLARHVSGKTRSALRRLIDDGHVILETYNSSLGDFAFERGMFHDVCPDGDAFVTSGLAFVKSGLAV